MVRRPKGTGSIFRRGRIWFVQFYWHGEGRRESPHSEDPAKAEQLLHKRLGEIATGRYLGITAEKVTLGALIDLVVEDYKFRKLRSAAVVEWRTKAHLEGLRENSGGEIQRLRDSTVCEWAARRRRGRLDN